jgi:methionyl-tRNA formyltransferase
MGSQLRIVYMSMGGGFGRVPFQALLEVEHDLVGLLMPHPLADLAPIPPQAPPANLSLPLHPGQAVPGLHDLAARYDVPVYQTGSPDRPEGLAALKALDPDLLVVACFPHILPKSWLEVPALGCLNLHPSLLPAYRGPHPLFWQFRAGEPHTGASVHFMDTGVDSGELLDQAPCPLPDGILGPEADVLVAKTATELLLRHLRPPLDLGRRAQPLIGSSYQSHPTPDDRIIPVTWPVRRAYNFIRGANEWAPFWIEDIGSKHHGREIQGALEHRPGAASEPDWIQFSDGALRVAG